MFETEQNDEEDAAAEEETAGAGAPVDTGETAKNDQPDESAEDKKGKKGKKDKKPEDKAEDDGDISVEDKVKQARKQLEDAEKRFRVMIEKRDELHKESNVLRDERDALHKERREVLDRIKELKDERGALVEKMREHKKRRDQAQGEAKRLIARKRGKTQEIQTDLVGQIDDLETELNILDYKYQTEPLSLEKENEYLDDIRNKYKRLQELKKLKPDHIVLLGEIDDINERITALFKLADEEHAEVDRFYKKSQEVHEKVQSISDGITHLIEEANKKHQEFIKLNERANHYHQRAMEMRGKILSIRRERKEVLSEAQKILDDINLEVKKRFEDDDAWEQVADDAVKKLKTGDRINL